MRAARPSSHEIPEAELEPEIPAHTEDNDFPVEMAAFEKIINAQHAGPGAQNPNSQPICPLQPFA